MQIRVTGEMTLSELRQAIFEALGEIEDEFAIRHSRGATLYFNPIDKEGELVEARNALGRTVSKVTKAGPYKSAADKYMP